MQWYSKKKSKPNARSLPVGDFFQKCVAIPGTVWIVYGIGSTRSMEYIWLHGEYEVKLQDIWNSASRSPWNRLSPSKSASISFHFGRSLNTSSSRGWSQVCFCDPYFAGPTSPQWLVKLANSSQLTLTTHGDLSDLTLFEREVFEDAPVDTMIFMVHKP